MLFGNALGRDVLSLLGCGRLGLRLGLRLRLGLLDQIGVYLGPVEQLVVGLGLAASAGAYVVLVDLAALGALPLVLFGLSLGLYVLSLLGCGRFGLGLRLRLGLRLGLLGKLGMYLKPVERLVVGLGLAASAGADVVLVDLAAAGALPLVLLGLACRLLLLGGLHGSRDIGNQLALEEGLLGLSGKVTVLALADGLDAQDISLDLVEADVRAVAGGLKLDRAVLKGLIEQVDGAGIRFAAHELYRYVAGAVLEELDAVLLSLGRGLFIRIMNVPFCYQ